MRNAHTRGIRLLNVNVPLWKQQKKQQQSPKTWNSIRILLLAEMIQILTKETKIETKPRTKEKEKWNEKRVRNKTDYTSLPWPSNYCIIFMSQIDRKPFFSTFCIFVCIFCWNVCVSQIILSCFWTTNANDAHKEYCTLSILFLNLYLSVSPFSHSLPVGIFLVLFSFVSRFGNYLLYFSYAFFPLSFVSFGPEICCPFHLRRLCKISPFVMDLRNTSKWFFRDAFRNIMKKCITKKRVYLIAQHALILNEMKNLARSMCSLLIRFSTFFFLVAIHCY